MSQTIGWRFPSAGPGGQREGFNAAAIDFFRGERLQSLVREMIQNSLDARVDAGAPVSVRFTLDRKAIAEIDGLAQLDAYFAAAASVEKEGKGADFYRAARSIMASREVTFLGVHDSNTTGLAGPIIDDPMSPPSGAWLALTKGAGVTAKASDAALGSFGHGSRAPFAASDLRTVYYFSRVQHDGAVQERFQGKSILQSLPLQHVDPEAPAELSVATGYYGTLEACGPLLDDGIPSWPRTLRRDDAEGTGTSVYVLAPFGFENTDDLWTQIRLAVIANFYYAVHQGNLVVRLGDQDDETIDATSVADVFDELIASGVLDEQRNRSTDNVIQRMESAKTVRFAPEDARGVLDIPGFGTVDWFLRLDDVQRKAVGVARGNGMLITRRAEKLIQFNGALPFDLFLCVTGHDGSELLRSTENPEHTDFQFDRIEDDRERREKRAKYTVFVREIKKLIEDRAGIQIVETIAIDDLDDLFRGIDGEDGAGGEEGERSRQLRLGRNVRKRTGRENRPSPIPGSTDDVPGAGRRGGDGEGGGEGGGFPDAGGSGTARGGTRSGLPVKNLRVVRSSPSDNVALVHFTPLDDARRSLVLLRSGEKETSRLEFRVEGSSDWVDSVRFTDIQAGARKTLRLEFRAGDLEFAIEGRLEP